MIIELDQQEFEKPRFYMNDWNMDLRNQGGFNDLYDRLGEIYNSTFSIHIMLSFLK